MRQVLLSHPSERWKGFDGRAVRANGAASFFDAVGPLSLLLWSATQEVRLKWVWGFTVSGEP